MGEDHLALIELIPDETKRPIIVGRDGVYRARYGDEERDVPPEVVARAEEIANRVPVPAAISDRQFFQALARQGLITPAEAMAAVKIGEIPAGIVTLIDRAESMGLLPEGVTRFDIEMVVAGATIFERRHPTTLMLTGLWGWTDAETDAFFRDAAAL